MKKIMFIWKKKMLYKGLLGILMLCFGAHAGDGFAQIDLPQPTGNYGVGRTPVLHFEDTARFETFTPVPDDYRQIMVQIWYPTAKDADGSNATYMAAQTAEVYAAVTAEALTSAAGGDVSALYASLSAFLSSVTPNAIDSAPPAEANVPFPMLIFSPGNALIYQAYQIIIEEVVSHGYVVAAINHPYISGVTVLSDGSMVETATVDFDDPEDYYAPHSMLVADILFLSGKLETVQIQGASLSLDMENMGFFGHSIGGSAAVEACLQLDQAKGAIDIDGTLWGDSHQQSVKKPLFFLLSEQFPLAMEKTVVTAWENVGPNGFMMNLAGSTHGTFHDSFFLFSRMAMISTEYAQYYDAMRGDMGTIDPQLGLEITSDYIVAFFDVCLKGAPLKTIISVDYPEAAFKTTRQTDADNDDRIGCFISTLAFNLHG